MCKFGRLRILFLSIFLICTISACSDTAESEIKRKNDVLFKDKTVDSNRNSEPQSIVQDDNGKEQLEVESGDKWDEQNEIKSWIMRGDVKEKKEDAFEVKYKNIPINRNTDISDITKKLGLPDDYEANNQGYISGDENYRRWNLCYPSYGEPEIRIIVLSERKYLGDEVVDGIGYIESIYLEKYSTNNGLRVGDDLEKVLQLYGKPDSFDKDIQSAEGLYYLRYSNGVVNLDITLDKFMEKVKYILIDYSMKKPLNK